jgi:lysophospholipase L1-like esterase
MARLLIALATILSVMSASYAVPFNTRWLLNSGQHWVDIWTTQPSAAAGSLSGLLNTTDGILYNTTIRQTVRVGLDSNEIRLRISNNFGNQALNITSMTVAYPGNSTSTNANGTNTGTGSPLIIPGSLHTVTFSGNKTISLPNGALGVSDPIALPVKAQSQISISIYLATGQGGLNITGHLTSQTDSWFGSGDQTNASNITGSNVTSADQWYFISAVEGWLSADSAAFAIIGDSITDGVGTDINGNNRWPDQLLERMQSQGDSTAKKVAIANQAWNGNKVLLDGSGASAISRIERDVIAQSGVAYAMIFDGINDLGHTNDSVGALQKLYDDLVQGYSQIVTRAHTAGIPVFASTITPFSAPGYNVTLGKYSGPNREQYRVKLNEWIKNSGKFDYVVDFASVVQNQTEPSQYNTTLGHGDYLHYNPLGYRLMAEAFDLSVFSRFAGGVSGYQ